MGGWRVKRIRGRNHSGASDFAGNANTEAHGRTAGLRFDGRWKLERTAGFRHLKSNMAVQVLGRNSLAVLRILAAPILSVSAAPAKLSFELKRPRLPPWRPCF